MIVLLYMAAVAATAAILRRARMVNLARSTPMPQSPRLRRS